MAAGLLGLQALLLFIAGILAVRGQKAYETWRASPVPHPGRRLRSRRTVCIRPTPPVCCRDLPAARIPIMFRIGLAVSFPFPPPLFSPSRKSPSDRDHQCPCRRLRGQDAREGDRLLRDGLITDVRRGDAKLPPRCARHRRLRAHRLPRADRRRQPARFDPALRRSAGGPPAPEDLASDILAATKPDNRKGLTPEFEVSSALKATRTRSPRGGSSGSPPTWRCPRAGSSTARARSSAERRRPAGRGPAAGRRPARGAEELPRPRLPAGADGRHRPLPAGAPRRRRHARRVKAFEERKLHRPAAAVRPGPGCARARPGGQDASRL